MRHVDRTVVMSWVGRAVIDRDGSAIGVCTAAVPGSTAPEMWLRVEHAERSGLAPALGATESDAQVQVQATRDQVFSAPGSTSAGFLSDDEAAALRRHYGIATGGPRMLQLLGGVAALVALAVAAVRLRRLRRSEPPTPAERLGRVARSASSSLGSQARQGLQAGTSAAGRAVALAAPALATAGQTATHGGRRVGARAAEVTTTAASKVGEVAVTGATLGQHVGHTVGHSFEAVPAAISESTEVLQKRWNRFTTRVTMATALAGGYVLGARAGRARYEQLRGAAREVLARPEVQQARERLMPTGDHSSTRAVPDQRVMSDPLGTTPAL